MQPVISFFASLLHRINFASPSWDLFVILFFLVGTVLYGFSLGRERIVLLTVAMYMALAVVHTAPYLETFRANIHLGGAFAVQVTTFLGIFLLLFFFISKRALSKSFRVDDRGSWWEVLIFAALHVGLLTSVFLQYLPPQTVASLSPLMHNLFVGDPARLAWIMLPLFAMFFLRGTPRT